MTAPDIHRTISAVWRIESPRLVAALARITRDVGLAEDMAQDALVAALEEWPKSGVPERPGAWLMTAAKRLSRYQAEHWQTKAFLAGLDDEQNETRRVMPEAFQESYEQGREHYRRHRTPSEVEASR